ncbi:hypothetical protein GOODEAATRI_020317 [Goodea atripinnis]|uniref:Inward rectifier potassium channel C-terminal domain-containing protein n=1 Tax=Goodea atripinnis TaxID=208336 RepID=A0ABV0P6E6_9TELE
MCLMIRVANLVHRPLVDVKVSAVLYEEQDGQALYQTSLDFHLDHLGQRPCPFFIFPLTFYHKLDRQSPLYPALCEGTSNHFELVFFLTALQEGTGDSCQKRTSYLRQEIQFDRRFLPASGLDARGRSVFRHYRVTQRDQGGYVIDVENPIPCATLHDVIDALVEKTAGTLQPFLLEEPYEENINRWCTSPLSRSPAADRRTLTSPVPASPTNPMRRLILSPSPLTQSEYDGMSAVPAAFS